MEGQGRSEGLVLQKTVQFLRGQLEERRQLIESVEQSGGHVSDSLKKLVALTFTLCDTNTDRPLLQAGTGNRTAR